MAARPKLAAVVTVYRKHSHAQHIVDRFLEGYGWNGQYHHPAMDLVSLYVDQVGPDDLSRDRARRFSGMKIYPTVAEALTRGTSKLAVDGVVLVGEHGEYPRNEKGQIRYPRYEFFQQILKVYRASGRSVPIFNDKHLSWNWEWAKQMYDASHQMGFPLMAGSSLPITWRLPSIEMPMGAGVKEALTVCYGPTDGYDFHGLEATQCMVERRPGGENGVRWIQAYRGEKFWDALKAGAWSRSLMEAALCRSQTLLPTRQGFSHVFPSLEDLRRVTIDPTAYVYEHHDGLKCAMLLMAGLVGDFSFAARIEGRRDPLSTQMYLPMPTDRTTLASFFSPLNTRKLPYPLERTLLTTGLTIGGVESLYRGQTRYETPHLAIQYKPTYESTYWRT
jgi:hypothetical protein